MRLKSQLAAILISASLLAPAAAIFAAGKPESDGIDLRSYHLGGIASWSEVVNIGIKRMALSSAMPEEAMDELLEAAQGIANDAGVSTYRESNFLSTDLFPLSATQDKHVLIVYRGSTLDEYLALKKRKNDLVAAGNYSAMERKEIAWALGKLLSYPDEKINQLLSRNATTKQ